MVDFVDEEKMSKVIHLKLLQQIQSSLNNALTHWLYSSIANVIPVGALEIVSVTPLKACLNALKTAKIAIEIPIDQLNRRVICARKYAEILAHLYQQWDATVKTIRYAKDVELRTTIIPKAQLYEDWINHGGNALRYRPVHNLRHLLKTKGSNFFICAIVHGSIATLDDTPGFSDMDLAFIINRSTLRDKRSLLHLRSLAREILIITYSFDPFMHHGPYYISEIDLDWYPEPMFPPALFNFALYVLEPAKELSIGICPSGDITDNMLDMFENFFRKWASNPFILKNNFDVEWVLGSSMLLPALYLQRISGMYRYKRDTFPIAKKDFTSEQWEPIELASKLRTILGNRPKPPSRLIAIARCLRWPGLLRLWAKRHPISINRGKEVTKELGEAYPKKVLELLAAMKVRIAK